MHLLKKKKTPNNFLCVWVWGPVKFSFLSIFGLQPNNEKYKSFSLAPKPQHRNPNPLRRSGTVVAPTSKTTPNCRELQLHPLTIMAMDDSHSSLFNLGILDTLTQDELHEILDSYNAFCNATQSLLGGAGDLSYGAQFVSHVHTLCKHGLESLVRDHFLRVLEVRNKIFHY